MEKKLRRFRDKNQKYGFRDPNGIAVIPAQWDRISHAFPAFLFLLSCQNRQPMLYWKKAHQTI